jgi:hypothetical protein
VTVHVSTECKPCLIKEALILDQEIYWLPILTAQCGGNNACTPLTLYGCNFQFRCCVIWSFLTLCLEKPTGLKICFIKVPPWFTFSSVKHDSCVHTPPPIHPFFSAGLNVIQNFWLFYIVLLHGTVRLGILYTTSATFYFSCCILQNIFQIDSFFNCKCSTVHRNYFLQYEQ